MAPSAASVYTVTAASLSCAIAAAQTTEMRERASLLGAKMRTEDGLAIAIQRVRALMAGS